MTKDYQIAEYLDRKTEYSFSKTRDLTTEELLLIVKAKNLEKDCAAYLEVPLSYLEP